MAGGRAGVWHGGMDLAPTRLPALTAAQVDAYLARIGIARPTTADARSLAALQRAHLRAVPFENLSIGLGEPVVLEPEALAAYREQFGITLDRLPGVAG